MSTGRKWSLLLMAVLAVVMLFEVGLSYALGLYGARHSTSAWFRSALVAHAENVHEALLGEIRPRVDDATRGQSFVDHWERGDEEAVERDLLAVLPSTIEFWVAGTAQSSAAHARCASAHDSSRLVDEPALVSCDGEAFLVSATRIGSSRSGYLVYGLPLGPEYVERIKAVVGAEVVLYDAEQQLLGTFRDVNGNELSIPRSVTRGDRFHDINFAERTIHLEEFVGYSTAEGEVFEAGTTNSTWYSGSRPMGNDHALTLAVFVPQRLMTIAATYSLAAMAVSSLVVLVIVSVALYKLISRQIQPIRALSASARGVANGDLTLTVPIPRDADMRGLCVTYNQMLTQLSEHHRTQTLLSRRAGKAEMATSVLHNVGNALNTVSVSVGLACEKAANLPTSHLDDLASYVSSDPSVLFELANDPTDFTRYLEELCAQMAAEKALLIEEMQHLQAGVDHMNAIVRAQQAHAADWMLLERCRLGSVIDESLRVAGLTRDCGIVVARDLPADTVLHTDRHAVVQILVNLFRNAAEAIEQADCPAPTIMISATRSDDSLEIAVTDNGTGIPPEEIATLFAFGVTTKDGGHGFGLHGSALAAKRLGGALRAENRANAPGAVFVLRLPLSADEAMAA